MDHIQDELGAIHRRLLGEQRQPLSEFLDMLDHAVAAILVDAETGIVIHATSYAESMFGYISGELIGKPFDTLVPPELREQHALHVAGYKEKPVFRLMGKEAMILTGWRRDGGAFPVSINLFPRVLAEQRLVVLATIHPKG